MRDRMRELCICTQTIPVYCKAVIFLSNKQYQSQFLLLPDNPSVRRATSSSVSLFIHLHVDMLCLSVSMSI